MSDWISVKDRLPTEPDGTVLVCMPDIFPYNQKEPIIRAKHNRRINIGRYSEYSKKWYLGDWGSMAEIEPIAWMPLPGPAEVKSP